MRQPQAQARPLGFCCHIRFEQMLKGLSRHAGTVVGDRDVDSLIPGLTLIRSLASLFGNASREN
jgi:hypothetical protein